MWSILRVVLGMTSNFVTNEALVVFHMFSFFYGGERNGIEVSCCPGKERPDASSSLESSDSFLLSMELACLSNLLIQHGGDVLD